MTLINRPLNRLSQVSATAVSSPAAETAILSTDAVQGMQITALGSPQPAAPVKITVTINVTTGATVTALVARLRQGVGLAGALVPTAGATSQTVTTAATTSYNLVFVFRDVTGIAQQVGGLAYTFSLAETGGGTGTVNDIDITVDQ